MRQSTKKINSVEKALAILLTFTPNNQEMGTVEISKKLGLHKATVSRNLITLKKYGFLQRNPHTKKFRLGRSAINLGLAVKQSINDNMVHLAKPYIDDLRDKLKETIVLELASEGSTTVAYIAEGPGPIRIKSNVGDSLPFHAAAGAKAILAFSPSSTWENYLNVKLKKYTTNTIINPKILKKHLQDIKKQGFSFDNEEVHIGIRAVSAPILNHESLAVAAIVAAGLSQKISLKSGSNIISVLKDTAAKISVQLYNIENHTDAEQGLK